MKSIEQLWFLWVTHNHLYLGQNLWGTDIIPPPARSSHRALCWESSVAPKLLKKNFLGSGALRPRSVLLNFIWSYRTAAHKFCQAASDKHLMSCCTKGAYEGARENKAAMMWMTLITMLTLGAQHQGQLGESSARSIWGSSVERKTHFLVWICTLYGLLKSLFQVLYSHFCSECHLSLAFIDCVVQLLALHQGTQNTAMYDLKT